ncbi:hypothetical protein QR680_014688 [Steinernema hermaphroditum]|uniref:Uncharacterized protein n=1 Tax=Steinernema hermaphroditum TaxID=289476 RepID=A0AA39IC17_9BILA|nr:hypothetical protein QR680_014688 [Steinernema hermaphroditum]
MRTNGDAKGYIFSCHLNHSQLVLKCLAAFLIFGCCVALLQACQVLKLTVIVLLRPLFVRRLFKKYIPGGDKQILRYMERKAGFEALILVLLEFQLKSLMETPLNAMYLDVLQRKMPKTPSADV